ncbi:signal peptidase I [Pontibacillus yanchengensis]|uniref:Signal peptidase I n=1 Tax=Pontibacillus yanchengensis TaxID=462910 RepID=A0ACC7VHC9_9BACI|nr:signal peptidase I [Pontibacillus yanchengensis]MYL54336.1 signal peptidase I [Pontibacillus yanchengensis]
MSWKKSLSMLGSTLNILLFIAMVCMIFVVITSKASGGEPNVFGYQLKTVLSGSMEPTFKTGSIIAVEPIEGDAKKQLKVGDVITFVKEDNTLVTHRILEVNGGENAVTYHTKGDNNDAADVKPVLAENVVGKYADFTIPYAGHVMKYANSKAGSIALMIIPGVLLILYSVVSIFRSFKDYEKSIVEKNSANNESL